MHDHVRFPDTLLGSKHGLNRDVGNVTTFAVVSDRSTSITWQPDVLGEGYDHMVIPLGADPDGEGDVVATVVRFTNGMPASPTTAVLYVHGMSDYFFQRHVAEHFADLGYAFFALDLRKCGRSRLDGQTPHYVSSLSLYDADLDSAMRVIRTEHPGIDVLLVGHSTGGLVLPLWLTRRRKRMGAEGTAGFKGMILNSPFFDLPTPVAARTAATALVEAVGAFAGKRPVPREQDVDIYGASLHNSRHGEWDYNLDWKPLTGFPVRIGWLRAIRRGQIQLHRGLDLDVPALILRSKLSGLLKAHAHLADVADLVLDVRQIQKWSGCIGDLTTVVPIVDARHDVFLSSEAPRKKAFSAVDRWLRGLED